MRRPIPIIVLTVILFIPAAAFATLELDTVSTIVPPQGISASYFADIFGDSVDEVIIICCQSSAYVFDAFNETLLSTVSMQTYPTEFRFRDMNNDGHNDLIYCTSSNIYIYDIADSTLLWTSPTIGLPFKYAIGDRNSDGNLDIVVVRSYPISTQPTPDTAWVEIYDGPGFQLQGQTYFLITRYYQDYSPSYRWARESPTAVYLENLYGNMGIEPRIIVFTDYEYSLYQEYYGLYQLEHYSSGNIQLINPQNYSAVTISSGGVMTALKIDSTGNEPIINCVLEYPHTCDGVGFPAYYHNTKFIAQYDADGTVIRNVVWHYDNQNEYHPYDWFLYLLDDIDPSHEGLELLYGTGLDTLNSVSCADSVNIWSIVGNNIYGCKPRLLHSPIFNSPQLLSGVPLVTISPTNGTITGRFGGLAINISDVKDLNHNGEDEVIYTQSNHLYIYHVEGEPEVGINDDTLLLPGSFCLHANYPNPFNAQTIISYDLPKEAEVKLEIYDLLGRKITTLAEGHQEAGTHQVIWDGSGVSSGLYFYRLKAGEYSDIKKMTLLK